MATKTTKTFSFNTAKQVFQEGSTAKGSGYIDVSKSQLRQRQNRPNSIRFETAGTFKLSVGETAIYLDYQGNILLKGFITEAKDLNKGGSESKYDVEIQDESYDLARENLNKVYRDILPEEIIKEIVESFGLTFQNNLPFTSNQKIDKKVYQDIQPIEAINELSDTLNAMWETSNGTFILYQRGQNLSNVTIIEDENWQNLDGFTDDADKKAGSIIVKGQKILQRTQESFSGTFSSVTLSRKPFDVEISGLTQTTSNINGDYTVDVQNKTITFNNSQTDPSINYSYYSQIRVKVGNSKPVKTLERKYIETTFEARELGRSYLDIYKDGITYARFRNTDFFDTDISNLRVGNRINITAKNSNRSGEYLISRIKRKYPDFIEIQVGEDTSDLFNWQKEVKNRIKQLESLDLSNDFITLDEYNTGSLSVDFSASFTDLYIVHNTGEILWARNTPFSNDADYIDNNSQDSQVALAYNEDSLPSNSVTDLIGNSQSLQ